VGDMAPGTQAKILRLMQEGQFQRVGGSESLAADVRILAATNQNLESLIEQGKFRKDLYYRLRGVTICLPPLRERREDIAELAHYFLFRFNRQLGTSVQSISADALELLEKFAWPGNVRQLQSVIREALIVAVGPSIMPDFLPLEIHQDKSVEPAEETETGPLPDVDWKGLPEFVEAVMQSGETDVYRRALEHFDRLLISLAMQKAEGKQVRAAEILGLSRVTLRHKLKNMGLAIEKTLATQKSENLQDR
jgi:DNA-binding NtrC family response regulator